ncbi:MAG: hypothetical protein Kow0037_24670 [Calditrichia bacterium]
MQSWAVFDIDGTLLPGESLERRFLRLLKEKGILRPHHYLPFLLELLIKLPQFIQPGYFKSNKRYYRGLPAAPILALAESCVREEAIPTISKKGLEYIEHFKKEGVNILLLSGSPEFLVKPLAEMLVVPHYIGCRLEVKDHRFTGKLSGAHPFGTRKTDILRDFQKKNPINFKESIVFANHHSDYDHMKLFGRAVAVNPTPRLHSLAKKINWPVEWW